MQRSNHWSRRLVRSLLALMALFAFSASPALAHKDHKKKQEAAEHVMPAATEAGHSVSAPPAPDHSNMAGMMEDKTEERSDMPFFQRLLDWLGRLHPVIVHFPIAFFPAALLTAIASRKRPGFAAPTRLLVIAGGLIAPVAMMLGWFDAIGADPDPLLAAHRWLGTGIGVAAFGLAGWAWKHADSERSNAMLAGLALLTIALAAQGWLGGALVHGPDHLNW